MANTKTPAQKRYDELYEQAEMRLKTIHTLIKNHKKDFTKSSNWGYVGDMGYIASKLGEVLESFIKED